MNRHIRWLLGLAAILLPLAVSPRPVHADGGAFGPTELDVEMPAQKAILAWDEVKGHEDLILSVELLGGPEAAWVVPVPSLPEVKAASPRWFTQLSDLTEPRIEYQEETVYYRGQCVTIVEKGVEEEVGVELISREEVGVYDVSILSADEPGALLDWLNENGYAFPEEGGPILDAYVEEGGWYFVAARVVPGKSATLNADVQPLWFSFDAERPVYPMRLTSLMKGYLNLLIYVLADHRMEIAGRGFTEFAGELTLKGWEEEDDEVVELLTHRMYYVTRLRCRSVYAPLETQDFYLDRASSDRPYRQVIYVTKYVCPPATKPPPWQALMERSPGQRLGGSGWLLLGVGLLLFGLLVGLGLAWRQRSRRKSDDKQEV